VPSLGLAACVCIARRAIPTSFQQPDRWTLIDKGSASGKEISQRGVTWSQTLKAQGTVHGPQRIENNHRTAERIMMKPSTDDKTTGKLHEVKGAIKQKAGELTSNPNLAADGKAEKNAGKVQKIVGKVEKAIGE
jgi:uncharacterized protein YjbJ (UPF0337 family)